MKYEKRGARAVERGGRGLALHRRFVDGAIAEINQLLGMPDGEARIDAGVAGVGRRHRVTAAQSVAERGVLNRAAPRAVADREELAVPSRSGSQTSDLMSESLVGLIVSATRQNAGQVRRAGAAPPPGGVNLPAATSCGRAHRRIRELQRRRQLLALGRGDRLRLCGGRKNGKRGGEDRDSHGYTPTGDLRLPPAGEQTRLWHERRAPDADHSCSSCSSRCGHAAQHRRAGGCRPRPREASPGRPSRSTTSIPKAARRPCW